MVGRLRVGVQELRRRRAVGHDRAGLRVARPHDQRLDVARRPDGGGGGGARHRYAPLPRAPEGARDVDQFDRLDLRLDAGSRPSRQARRQREARQIRRDAREGLRRHGRGGLYDQGPRAVGRAGAEMAVDRQIPRQGRREPQSGDGGLTQVAPPPPVPGNGQPQALARIPSSTAVSASWALAPSGPPAWAISARPPPPLPPRTAEPRRTRSTALKRWVWSGVTATTRLALPSSPVAAIATTPEPRLCLASSASHLRSFMSTPVTARE